MLCKIENIVGRIPLLKENPLSVNFLVLLAAFTFVVITVDLQTEIAAEKDEISAVVAVMEQSLNSSAFDVPFGSYIDFPLLGLIPETNSHITPNDIFTCLKDRSPPITI